MICQSWVWLQTELDETKSCYQLIKTMIKFEYCLFIFIKKKKTVNSMKCKTTVHTHDTFCPLTQAWHVSYPFNCPITLSNYKHVVYNVLSVGLVMMSDNFVVVLLTIIITYVLNRPEGVYDNSYNPRGDKHCLPFAGIHATTNQCFRSNSGWQQWTCFASKHNPIWSGKYTVTPLNSISDRQNFSFKY